MRLLNTETFELKEYFGTQIPVYAILSHTWGDDEFTYQEWTRSTWKGLTQTRAGFLKIKGACQQATRDRLQWLWVDTICIDKTSSAELAEAINSMYEWYKKAFICYAFLVDVPLSSELHALHEIPEVVQRSRWFTRGWTLQELVAPKEVVFYSTTWSKIGDRNSLAIDLSKFTGISSMILGGRTQPTSVSVAMRMSWLSQRTTTRIEDMAYCMLGLFDVNMPLLYGEGVKAFRRLQEEIIKVDNDHSIFCWTWNRDVPNDWVSLLAPCPSVFDSSSEYVPVTSDHTELRPFTMTNVGLSLKLPVVFTLGHLFVQLNARIQVGERAHILLFRGVQYEMGNTFGRLRYPESPVMLAGTRNERAHRMIVRAKPHAVPMNPNSIPSNPRHSCLFIVDHTAHLFLPNSSRHSERLVDPADVAILSYPPSCFDRDRGTLTLPIAANTHSTLRVVLLVLVPAKTGVPFGFFFATKETERTGLDWTCSTARLYYINPGRRKITNGNQRNGKDWIFAKIKDGRLEGLSNGDIPVSELLEKEIQRLRTKWKQKRYTESSDKSVYIEIGDYMTAYDEGDVKAVVLSGKKGSSAYIQDNKYVGDEDSDADSLLAQA